MTKVWDADDSNMCDLCGLTGYATYYVCGRCKDGDVRCYSCQYVHEKTEHNNRKMRNDY